jgi:hypothetical protein
MISNPPSKRKCNKDLCSHKRRLRTCKVCNPSYFCCHWRVKSVCKECKGRSVCSHDKIRSVCIECSPHNFCIHNRNKWKCPFCYSRNLTALRKFLNNPICHELSFMSLLCLGLPYPTLSLPKFPVLEKSSKMEETKTNSKEIPISPADEACYILPDYIETEINSFTDNNYYFQLIDREYTSQDNEFNL